MSFWASLWGLFPSFRSEQSRQLEARKAVAARRTALRWKHKFNIFGRRRELYTKQDILKFLARFKIDTTRETRHWRLRFQMKDYECELKANNDADGLAEAETFLLGFVGGPYYPMKACTICAEDRRVYNFPPDKISKGCQHEVDVCNICLEIYITEYVERYIDAAKHNNALPSLSCPLCDQKLDAHHIRQFGSSKDSEWFDHAAAGIAHQNHPQYQKCLQNGCYSGQVHSEKGVKMVCRTCHDSTCITHQVPWHKGITCKSYEQIQGNEGVAERAARIHKEDEVKSHATVTKTTLPCPTCQVPIQKDGGCAGMICINCKRGFIWPRDFRSGTRAMIV